MLIGGSMNLRDKRADRMLQSATNAHCEIFYSPIQGWVVFWGLLGMAFLGGGSVLFILLVQYIGDYILPIILSIPLYFFAGYLIAGKLNNSFAIAAEGVWIINPNWPWRKGEFIVWKSIEKIKIGENKKYFLARFFGMSELNYLEIKTGDRLTTFYCAGLGIDCFDENFTEKTLDDLKMTLEKKELKIEWTID